MFEDIEEQIRTIRKGLADVLWNYGQLQYFEEIDLSTLQCMNVFTYLKDEDVEGPDVEIPREHWEEFRKEVLLFMAIKLKETTSGIHIAYSELKHLNKQPRFTPYSYPTVVIINPLSRVKQPKKQKRSTISKPKVDLTEMQFVAQDNKPRNKVPKIQFWIVRETSVDKPQIITANTRPKNGTVLGGYAKLTTAEEALSEIVEKGKANGS